MASWTRRVSVETLKTMSPVRASVSKNPTSCFSTASKYFFLRAPACLSPVCIQQAISVNIIKSRRTVIIIPNKKFLKIFTHKFYINFIKYQTFYKQLFLTQLPNNFRQVNTAKFYQKIIITSCVGIK